MRAVGLLLVAAACAPPDVPERPRGSGGPAAELAELARPTLAPLGPGAVHLLAPGADRPVAYLSTAERRVYVGRGHRDAARRLLGAHVSVSTGLWRIALAGDDPRVPVVPDDTLREFVETDLAAWDPRAPPRPGDVRLRQGAPDRVRVTLACAPVTPDGGWVRASTLVLGTLAGGEGPVAREDFARVARGTRYADRDCTKEVEGVDVLTWVPEQRPD